MAAKKELLTAAQIASAIKANERRWFIGGLSRTDIKKFLRGDMFRINNEVFADAMEATCKYYGVIKKKSKSTQDVLSSEDWDKLKLAVEALWSEVVGLTILQGYELIRTRVRTNQKQLMGLPNRLQYWNFKETQS